MGCGDSGGDSPAPAPAPPAPPSEMEIIPCATDDSSRVYKNFGYIFSGYNIFKGDPTAPETGADPGFTGRPLFKTDFSQCQKTADQEHIVPKGVHMIDKSSCAVSWSQQVSSSAKSYAAQSSHGMSISAQATVPVPEAGVAASAGFGLSNSYHNARSDISQNNFKMTSSHAECSVYEVTLSTDPPATSSAFGNYIHRMSMDNASFHEMFDAYGTHYLTQVRMGSKYGHQRFIGECAAKHASMQSHQKSFNFNLGLETVDDAKAGIGAGWDSSSATQDEEVWHQAFHKESKIVLGEQLLASDVGEGDWGKRSKVDPMPIRYDMDFICNHPAMNSHQEQCTAALGTYCQYLQKSHPDLPCLASEEPDDPECMWSSDCGNGQDDPLAHRCEDGKCVRQPMPQVVIKQPAEEAGKGYECRELTLDQQELLNSEGQCFVADDKHCPNAPSGYFPLTWSNQFYAGRITLPEGLCVQFYRFVNSWHDIHTHRCLSTVREGVPKSKCGPVTDFNFWDKDNRVGGWSFYLDESKPQNCRPPPSSFSSLVGNASVVSV